MQYDDAGRPGIQHAHTLIYIYIYISAGRPGIPACTHTYIYIYI